jgi:hypothetical protein
MDFDDEMARYAWEQLRWDETLYGAMAQAYKYKADCAKRAAETVERRATLVAMRKKAEATQKNMQDYNNQ